MKQYQIAEAKSRFSEVLKTAEKGEPVEITRGKKREPVAYVITPQEFKARTKRVLGTLEHWGEITIADDWAISDEEFLRL